LVSILTNKIHKVKYIKTNGKGHFMLRANCYMFRHQGAIPRKFNCNKGP